MLKLLRELKLSKKVLFIYNSDYTGEISAYRERRIPGHWLFGLAGFLSKQQEVSAQYVQIKPGWFLNLIYKLRLFKLVQTIYIMVQQRKIDVIVAGYESPAFWVLWFKALGLIRKPLIVLSIALLREEFQKGLRKKIIGFLLRRAEKITTYTSAQLSGLKKTFKLRAEQLSFLPLCVDDKYFSPVSSKGNYLLSVGTNRGKDFKTLIEAVTGLAEKLLIVTDAENIAKIKKISSLPQNVELCLGNMPILELRNLYAGAKMMIVPVFDAPFSTGQTVLLENMALGKPVIVSRAKCLLDYALPESLVSVKDSRALRKKIDQLLRAPAAAARLGTKGRKAIETRFNLKIYAAQLCRLIEDVTCQK